MKLYRGRITRRDEQAGRHPIVSRSIVIVDSETGKEGPLPLHPSLRLKRYSPNGFNWGYGGSGPAQAALAILLDCLGPVKARKYYHSFKWDFLVELSQEAEWEITETDITGWMERMEARERKIEDERNLEGAQKP